MHYTGYLYDFPFLGHDNTITVDDNPVDPLYKHIFPPEVAPHLPFIGLLWKVILFPLFELQSKWVARVLSGQIKLPFEDMMMEDVKAFYLKLEHMDGLRDTHITLQTISESRHFARECRLCIGSGGLGSGRCHSRNRSRSRSRSSRYRRSPSYSRRIYSPRYLSPRRCSPSPARGRSYSRSRIVQLQQEFQMNHIGILQESVHFHRLLKLEIA